MSAMGMSRRSLDPATVSSPVVAMKASVGRVKRGGVAAKVEAALNPPSPPPPWRDRATPHVEEFTGEAKEERNSPGKATLS